MISRYEQVRTVLGKYFPYGFVVDDKKGVVIFNRDYEVLSVYDATQEIRILDIKEKLKQVPVVNSHNLGYTLMPEGIEFKGPTYYLYDSLYALCEGRADLRNYLICLGKLLPLFVKHSDQDDYYRYKFSKNINNK